MPRVLWKGAISFGLVHIPVGLYSAEKRNNFDLTMLDRRDMKPVGFKRYNKETGEDVPWDQIVKGYEYEKDRYVVLTDEDFRRANVEAPCSSRRYRKIWNTFPYPTIRATEALPESSSPTARHAASDSRSATGR